MVVFSVGDGVCSYVDVIETVEDASISLVAGGYGRLH
jgi:hypothetical protein